MESFKQYTKQTADRLSHSAGKILAAPLRYKNIREPVKKTIKSGLLLSRWIGKSLEQPQREFKQLYKEAKKETHGAGKEEKKIPVHGATPNDKDLHSSTYKMLYKTAQQYDIAGRSTMNKEELIKAIQKKRAAKK